MIEHLSELCDRANDAIGHAKSMQHSTNPQIAGALIVADAIERLIGAIGGIEDRLCEIRDKLVNHND